MTRAELRHILEPTGKQLAICVVASGAMFVAAYRNVLIQKLFGDTFLYSTNFQNYSEKIISQINKLQAVELGVQVAFYSGVVLLSYILYLVIVNTFIEIHNEVEEEYAYTNKSNFVRRWRRKFEQIIAALAFFATLQISGILLLPIWLNAFESFMALLPAVESLAQLALAFGGATATIYILWKMAKIVFTIA